MTMVTQWHVGADVVATVTIEAESEDGFTAFGDAAMTFADVIRVVHWTFTATDGDEIETESGSVEIPLPTSVKNYTDLDAIAALPEVERRATVLSWAEMIQPGLVPAVEARVVARLSARLAEPAVSAVIIL